MSLLKHFSNQKFFPLILSDGLCVFLAFLIALAFRFDGRIPAAYLHSFIWSIPLVILLYCVTNVFFGLYAHIWRYTGAQEVTTIAGSTAASTALLLLAMLDNNIIGRPIPLSVVILGGFFTAGAFTITRYRQRLLTGVMGRLEWVVGKPDRQRVLIVGAGEAGQFLARQLRTPGQRHRYELVGFVDDNPQKLGMRVHSVPVLGDRQTIPNLVTERRVGLIVIAIPNIPGPTLREILSFCLSTQAQVKILPHFLDIMDSSKGAPPLRDVTPADLLGRQPYQVDEAACRELVAGKVVLVTGAAGSIGSELCRQLLNFQPRQLLMLDNNETGLHDLAISFKHGLSTSSEVEHKPGGDIKQIIADVSNLSKIEQTFKTYRPQIIFHAAAYKHVPLLERQPDEAVRINVLGTKIVAELAARYAAERFVLISSDKAINPSSIMGATKRLGEMMIVNGLLAGDNGQWTAVSSGAIDDGRRTMDDGQRTTDNGQRTMDDGQQTTTPGSRSPTLNLQPSTLNPKPILPNPPTFQPSNLPTLFTAVRFGNVLGSRGSVVPTFTRQIELGGPVTITHPDMTRYFMSISEAVSLIIQAATLTEGGDIFMLDMGQKIRIVDLAHKMIRLRGLRPGQDIAIEYIGVRPGEKLHEELLSPGEERLATAHPKIFRLRQNSQQLNGRLLAHQISDLIELANAQRNDEVIEILWKLVRAKDRLRLDAPLPHRVGQ